ncbi:hypothetical protein WN59_10920 [Salinicoccus sediminis]|uniref:Uncharacterized protein n=1 Tax=Salinicoccus sediminis TaxID=1432562 RepID=A0A0M2SHA0_9STAP|nr:hypothetical protein WN59_10920 [Salinicoccus sediminis]
MGFPDTAEVTVSAKWVSRTRRKSRCPPNGFPGHGGSHGVRQMGFPDTAEVAVSARKDQAPA